MNCMVRGGTGGLRGCYWLDAAAATDGTLVLELGVLDRAVDEREDGEVAAEADVLTGMDDRPLLPHEDVAGDHLLAAETLDATHLRAGIAAVARSALSFFVSHLGSSLRADAGDLDRGERLAVTGLAAVPLAAAVLVDDELL